MPITGDLLARDLRQLGDLAAQVRGPVNDLLDAARDANSALTVDAGVDAVQRAVGEWAAVTEGSSNGWDRTPLSTRPTALTPTPGWAASP